MDVFSQQAGEFSPDGNIQVLGSSREIFLMFNDQLLKTEMSLGSREENKQGKNGTRSLLPKPRDLITPCYFLTKPPGCWRASSLAEVLRFPLGICCSGRGINGPQGGPSAPSKGQDEGTQFPNSLHIPQKAETRPIQPVPGVWDWRDSGWVPEQGDGSMSRLSQRSGRLLFQGDPWATAFPRILTDIYSPVSHSRPCLNQSDLAKTLKIAPFIPFPRSGYK